MITRLKVKNYRSIEEIDLTLSPLTVLVGKNGAGKSTILDVLAFVRDALSESIAAAIAKRGDLDALIRWTPDNSPLDVEIFCEFSTETISGSYSFAFGRSDLHSFTVKSESCVINSPRKMAFGLTINSGDITLSNNGQYDIVGGANDPLKYLLLPHLPFDWEFREDFQTAWRLLTNIEVYNIAPADIEKPQLATKKSNLLSNGGNIGEVLWQIQQNEGSLQGLAHTLSCMIDGVEGVEVTKTDDYFITKIKHHQKEGKASFVLAKESEGTLKALAFLAAIYQEHTHSLIAIEEPDAALYAFTLGVVNDVLREGLLRRQIIITTQSPDLLIYFGVDELRIVEKIDGITKVGMIDDTQRRIIEKEIFHAGDLLRIEGLYHKPVVDDEVTAVA